jgi:curved DNA-binding protein CbpA
MAKKIEEMDFYELLNLRLHASPREIEKAYLLAVATYHEEGLASYGVLSSEERQLILDRIEKAFQTLANRETRKAYDSAILSDRPEFEQKAYFRKSTQKLEIEDASEEEKFWDRMKSWLIPARRRKNKENHKDRKNGKDRPLSREEDHYYYGEFLKMVREKRGIALEQIAEDCRISLASLQALEEEDYDALPDGNDLSRLLRVYARCLGFDSENGRD